MTPELAVTLTIWSVAFAGGTLALYGLVRMQIHEYRRWKLARRMERRIRGIR